MVHTGILYGLHRGTPDATFADPPLFYETVDDFTAAHLECLVAETRVMRAALLLALQAAGVPSLGVGAPQELQSVLTEGYGLDSFTDTSSLSATYRTNEHLVGIRMPAVLRAGGAQQRGVDNPTWVVDPASRFLTDDVPWGLVVLRSLADLLGVATPAIDETLTFAQSVMGRLYLVDGELKGPDVADSGALQNFNVHSLEDLLRM